MAYHDPVVPDGIEIHTFDMNQKINSQRLQPELTHSIIFQKILFFDFRKGAKKFMEHVNDAFRILWRFPDEEVDVSSIARPAVSGDRVSTDDNELNPVTDQQFDALFEVAVNLQFRTHTFVT